MATDWSLGWSLEWMSIESDFASTSLLPWGSLASSVLTRLKETVPKSGCILYNRVLAFNCYVNNSPLFGISESQVCILWIESAGLGTLPLVMLWAKEIVRLFNSILSPWQRTECVVGSLYITLLSFFYSFRPRSVTLNLQIFPIVPFIGYLHLFFSKFTIIIPDRH